MEAGKIGFSHYIAGMRRCYEFEQIGYVAHKLSDSSEGLLTWCLQFMQGIWDRIQRAASKCSISSAGSELQRGRGGWNPCSGCLGKQVKMENGQSLAECTEKLCVCKTNCGRTTDIPWHLLHYFLLVKTCPASPLGLVAILRSARVGTIGPCRDTAEDSSSSFFSWGGSFFWLDSWFDYCCAKEIWNHFQTYLTLDRMYVNVCIQRSANSQLI